MHLEFLVPSKGFCSLVHRLGLEWNGTHPMIERVVLKSEELQLHLHIHNDSFGSEKRIDFELVCTRFFGIPVRIIECPRTDGGQATNQTHWHEILCELNGSLPYITDSTKAEWNDDSSLDIFVPNEFLRIRLEERKGMIRDAYQKRMRNPKEIRIFVDPDLSKLLPVEARSRDEEERNEADVVNPDSNDSVPIETYDPEVKDPDRTIDKQGRVELHVHTKMSNMDSIVGVDELVERVAQMGLPSVAITDHHGVQGYPEFYEECKKRGIKPIFGMEGNVVDVSSIVFQIDPHIAQKPINELEFVVFDLETTGLNPQQEEIIEIGAVRIQNGELADTFSQLVASRNPLSEKIQSITGIKPSMLEGKPDLKDVLPRFLDFMKGSILVAHNARFDMGFLKHHYLTIFHEALEYPYLDTLALSRSLLRMKSYSLDRIAKKLGLGDFTHHRALEDAQITAKAFLKLIQIAKKKRATTLAQLECLKDEIDPKSLHGQTITILVKNRTGLRNLYRIVSESHLQYYGSYPMIPKSLLETNRSGLLIGSGSFESEIAESFFGGATDDELIEIAKFYDYLEVMPPDAYTNVEQESPPKLREEFIQKIYQIGQMIGIPVVFSGNVHYLDPSEKKEWSILKIADASIRRKNTQFSPERYRNVNLSFRSMEEMTSIATQILGSPHAAYETVLANPLQIADSIEVIEPITRTLHPPKITGSEEEIRHYCWKRAHEIYGERIPPIIKERLDRELDAIIGHGFAVLYYIAHQIVKKSIEDGYLVGSRGSVGSSLVATLLDITEVHPMLPHYVCPSCHFTEFPQDSAITSGFDLPRKRCPQCGTQLDKLGQSIPFETFMGFSGEKIPDIDLNFSGEYQTRAHRTIEEMFGKSQVFRAGTISTMAEKTAFGYVQRYEDATGVRLTKQEKEKAAKKITGVKRTTGQHPGGLMIVPSDKEVYDFTPVQHPANDAHSDIRTTHFDYQSIHDDLVKIDALGHDDPTFMKMLKDLTGFDPLHVPMDDPKTLRVFSSARSIGLKPNDIPGVETGTLGIPEFGTQFVRGMLKETNPKSFADLVRISGLSHGTDVWLGNARELIIGRFVRLSELIACRDDIMNMLIEKGLEPLDAFKIMESVRKGKGITFDQVTMMKKAGLPEWFLQSCKKIKYLFPKAHAVAYVSMAFRVAFFKVHFPLAFYATYFSIKGANFDVPLITSGISALRSWLENPEKRDSEKSVQKISAERVVNELAMEMLLRGFSFLPVHIEQSDGFRFLMEENGLRIPLNRVNGLGDKVAQTILEARDQTPFSSVEDLRNRTSLSESTLEVLRTMNALNGMAESAQISLF